MPFIKHQPAATPPFSTEAEDYLVQNGYEILANTIITDAMVFLKNNNAVVLIDDCIEVKEFPGNGPVNAAQILFNWHAIKHYKGWDGQNTFQLMMLLDFMDAVKLKDVDREVRLKISTKNLLNTVNESNGFTLKAVPCQY